MEIFPRSHPRTTEQILKSFTLSGIEPRSLQHKARTLTITPRIHCPDRIVSGQIPIVYQELMPGFTPIPAILIGDPAYPLLPNMMKEYSSCLEEKHVIFNNKLRSARNQIGCAFGRLKARWRILNRPIDVDLDFAVTLIYSCFILHNFCERCKEDVHNVLLRTAMLNEQRCQNCQHDNQFYQLYSYNSVRGKLVRDTVAEYLCDIYS